MRAAQVDRLDVEDGGAGVEPADLEQVGEQRPRTGRARRQQLGRRGRPPGRSPSRDSWMQVGRHPDRRQRGAQLVRHVGDEPLLHRATGPRAGGSALEAVGHPVERRGEQGEVVLAAGRHPLVELAGGEPLRRPRRRGRTGVTTWRVTTQATAPTSRMRMMPATTNDVADQPHRRHLLLHRVDEVELVGAGVGHLDDAADDDGGQVLAVDGRPRSSGSADGSGIAATAACSSGLTDVDVEGAARAGWPARRRCRCRPSGHDDVAAGLRARLGEDARHDVAGRLVELVDRGRRRVVPAASAPGWSG